MVSDTRMSLSVSISPEATLQLGNDSNRINCMLEQILGHVFLFNAKQPQNLLNDLSQD
jgi:hypothetical protein